MTNKSVKIGVLNYSTGNVGSVCSALQFYKYDTAVVDNAQGLATVDLIVLAGVGNFPTAVARLKKQGLWDAVDKQVMSKKKPLLGICLGMQLFADESFEGGKHSGFGWIKGSVIKLAGENLRVPHIGWNKVQYKDTEPLFRGIRYGSYYFMHSYHFVPQDPAVIVSTTAYGNVTIISAVRKDNIIGVQFHPEKSQGDGLRLLRNAIEVLL
jgi:imidazole glycerol-phosphate synthase subunit HisH